MSYGTVINALTGGHEYESVLFKQCRIDSLQLILSERFQPEHRLKRLHHLSTVRVVSGGEKGACTVIVMVTDK